MEGSKNLGDDHTLDANMSVLAKGRALHGEGQGRAGGGLGRRDGLGRQSIKAAGGKDYLLEGLIVALIVGHFDRLKKG